MTAFELCLWAALPLGLVLLLWGEALYDRYEARGWRMFDPPRRYLADLLRPEPEGDECPTGVAPEPRFPFAYKLVGRFGKHHEEGHFAPVGPEGLAEGDLVLLGRREEDGKVFVDLFNYSTTVDGEPTLYCQHAIRRAWYQFHGYPKEPS